MSIAADIEINNIETIEPVSLNIEFAMEESNHESLLKDEFIWEYQMNADEWRPYPNAVSTAIEHAFNQRSVEILIDENYRVNLIDFAEEHVNDSHQQRRVRRRNTLSSNIFTDEEVNERLLLRERLSTPLGLPLSCTATEGTTYYGSAFIHDWLLMFTKGKMAVTFDTIFPALKNGLIKEGQYGAGNRLPEIGEALDEVKRETVGQCSKKRIERLKVCCAELYTKHCYIYRAVNPALRNNDQTKLYTLGPFCYLLFTYNGRRAQDNFSILDRLHRVFRPSNIRSMVFFRGDRNSGNILETYRQAMGDNSKRFKWLTFVSMSRNIALTERSEVDIIYRIEMRSDVWNEDQLADLEIGNDDRKNEEILLLPGVQFQVDKVELEPKTGKHMVYININSSYISKLK